MHQLIIVLMSIVLTAIMVTATAIYTPASKTTTEITYALTRDGFGTLDKAYQLYTKANSGGVPVVSGAADGGISTNFSDFLPFLPKAPMGYQWTYGYNSSQGTNYFCLYSTNTAAANAAVLTAFTRLQSIFSAGQFVVHAGGASNCGSVANIDLSASPTNVALTYFVKNVEDFSPKSIPGLVLWLDADDPGALALSGTNVTEWLDKSGFGNNAWQSTAGYMPAYNSAGFRGRGGLSFTRASYNYMEIPLSSSLTVGSVDIFVAGNLTSNGAQSTMVSSNTAASCSVACSTYALRQADVGGAYPVDSGVQFSVTSGGVSYYVEPTVATAALNTSAVWEGAYGGGSAGVAQDLTSASASASMDAPVFNLQIGRGPSAVQGQYLDGTLGEVLAYNRVLTAAERLRLQHYLGRKWSLTNLIN